MSIRSKKSKILFCSRGLFHPTFWGQQALCRILKEQVNASVIRTANLKFSQIIQEHQPDLIVLYIHQQKIYRRDLDALIEFVQSGHSLLAIHSASASFKQSPVYHQLLGGKFVSHGPIRTYTINPTKLIKNQKSFSIKDELYLHKYNPDVSIWLETQVEDTIEPVAWTKEEEKGNVAYFAPGHRGAIFQNSDIKATIHQLIQWSLCHDKSF